MWSTSTLKFSFWGGRKHIPYSQFTPTWCPVTEKKKNLLLFSNKEIFPCLCKKTKLLADLDILSFFLISILTFGLYLRQLEDEYEIIFINFFFKASFLSGSELWINSFHSCWDNRLFFTGSLVRQWSNLPGLAPSASTVLTLIVSCMAGICF